jgi:hypothetical protein
VKGDDASELADMIMHVVSMTEGQRSAIGHEAFAFCARAFSWDRHIVPAIELIR